MCQRDRFLIVSLIRNASCAMYAIEPLMATSPEFLYISCMQQFSREDFPEPTLPIIAISSPWRMSKLMSDKIRGIRVGPPLVEELGPPFLGVACGPLKCSNAFCDSQEKFPPLMLISPVWRLAYRALFITLWSSSSAKSTLLILRIAA